MAGRGLSPAAAELVQLKLLGLLGGCRWPAEGCARRLPR